MLLQAEMDETDATNEFLKCTAGSISDLQPA